MTQGIAPIDPSRSSVLLLGGKAYPSSRLAPVPAVERNLDKLKEAFEDPRLWGMSSFGVTSACDLSRSHMREAIKRSYQGSERDGIFVLYFAGHAQYHRMDGTLYLAPHDTKDIVAPSESMLSVNEVFEVTKQGRGADKKLLILDCCYAGGAIQSVPQEAFAAGGEGGGWYVMAATAHRHEALGDPQRETTFFTGALLKAFEGVAENRLTLSPQWVFDAASELIDGSEDVVGEQEKATLVPRQSSAGWADQPWLRNPRYTPPPAIPHNYPPLAATTTSQQPSLPADFHDLPSFEEFFVGRGKELESALKRFRKRAVLPVYGPRYAGKSAFVRQLLSTLGERESAPEGKPWLLLEITIPNSSAESPVLEGLARALELGLQDIDQSSDTEGDPRREAVIEQLQGCARGRTLILQIDCGSLGYDPKQISGELDQLLGHPYFRNTANIVISRVKVSLYQDEQLDVKPSVRLKELQRQEAVELLVRLLEDEGVAVDGDSILSHVQDRRLWLPGVLIQSANGYLEALELEASTAVPEDVATALVEGTVPRTAKTVLGLDCRLAPKAPETPEPLAVLAVWALTSRLSLPEHVLKSPSLGFPPRVLRGLEDAHVISNTGSGHYTLGQTSEQALRSLLITALTRDESVYDPDAVPAVGPADLNDLFPPELDPQEIDRRLASVAKPLLTAAGVGDTRESTDDSSDAAFQMRLRTALGWLEDEGGNRLPRLHDVFRTFVWAPAGDALYNPTSTDSLVRPATGDEQAADDPGPVDTPTAEEEITSLTWLYRLVHAGASLNVAARAEGTTAEIGERFVSAAKDFSSVLAACDPEQVPHTLLRSTDASLAITGKRLGLGGRLLSVRLAAVDMLLLGARQPGPGQAGRITLAVSWLLNTADSLIDADRLDEARELVDKADELVTEELPQDGTARSTYSQLQIGSRIARVRSRVCLDPEQSRRELLRAVRNIASGLNLAHEQGEPLTLWSIRLFEFAILLTQQSSTDAELVETRALVLDALEHSWGDRRDWPSRLCISTARFLRKVHVRCTDSELKQAGAKEAVALLEQLPVDIPNEAVTAVGTLRQPPPEPEDRVPSLNKQNDAKVLSSLAQAYGFLSHAFRENQHYDRARARLMKAEEYAYAAVLLAPTPFTYLVWLRQVTDIHRFAPRTGTEGEEAEKRRRACVKAVRAWLTREEARSYLHALLDLTCLRSDWAQEGSLRGASQRSGEEFLQLPPTESLRRIEMLYRQRKKKLQASLHRYGPSIELCAGETRLEREYCRWKGVLEFKVAKSERKHGIGPGPATRTPQVDNTPVFEIFREAKERWPCEARLIAAEAEFHRYIWDYDKAVELYEYLARTAPNGEVRRTARLSAAEAMLADMEDATPNDRSDWIDRLSAARKHLDTVISQDSRIGLALVLRERVAIRLGQPVNWEPIDAAFEAIVGNDYAGTVGRFLNRRHHRKEPGTGRFGNMARITSRGGADPSAPNSLLDLFGDYLDGHSSKKGDARTALNEAPSSLPHPGATDTDARGEDIGQLTAELLGELLLTDFTSEQLLKGFGKLYLDRASDLVDRHWKLHGNEPEPDSATAVEAAEHTRRAYDCFDACRILQEAHGPESIVTKFQRGRAITMAARYIRDPDPFPQALLEERGKQIKQAFSLILAAREHSVGGFNQVCSKWASNNNAVQVLLGLRAPQGG